MALRHSHFLLSTTALLFGLSLSQGALAGGVESVGPTGFYIKGNAGGASFQSQNTNSSTSLAGVNASTVNQVDSRSSLNFTWGGGLGWQVDSVFRLDATYQYLQLPVVSNNYDLSSSGNLTISTITARPTSNLYLLNGYIDLSSAFGNFAEELRPFIGGGVGLITNKVANVVYANSAAPAIVARGLDSSRTTQFAFRIILGFLYSITPNFKVFTQYSYVDGGRYEAGTSMVNSTGATDTNFNSPLKFRLQSSVMNLGILYIF